MISLEKGVGEDGALGGAAVRDLVSVADGDVAVSTNVESTEPFEAKANFGKDTFTGVAGVDRHVATEDALANSIVGAVSDKDVTAEGIFVFKVEADAGANVEERFSWLLMEREEAVEGEEGWSAAAFGIEVEIEAKGNFESFG